MLVSEGKLTKKNRSSELQTQEQELHFFIYI